MSALPQTAAAPSLYVPAIGRSLPLLIDVVEAGQLAGLSRDAAYRAVHAGGIPILRVGHRLRVRTGAWLAVLGLAYEPTPEATT